MSGAVGSKWARGGEGVGGGLAALEKERNTDSFTRLAMSVTRMILVSGAIS